MKSVVVCHGDCDGVISAYLYIKHFLIGEYPSNTELIFTQPWRAHVDLRRIPKEVSELVMLDIALNKEVVNMLLPLTRKSRVVVIDHHVSSELFVDSLSKSGVKVVWSKATSTPRLMANILKLIINPYEDLLVRVADVCEGVEGDEEVSKIADVIKLSIARDPGDTNFLNYLIKSMLKGLNISTLDEVVKRASIAKWLLNKLLKLMKERSVVVSDYVVTTLTSPESRIYAGILGIASTEFAKNVKSDVILIREEEGKVVVTVRSFKRNALNICKLISERLGGRYGGHVEAASATLANTNLESVQLGVLKVIKDVRRRNII